MLVGVGRVEGEESYPHKVVDILVPFSEGSSASSGIQILQEYLGKELPKGIGLSYKPGVNRQNLWRDIDSMPDTGYILAQFRVPELYLLELMGEADYRVKDKQLVMLYQCEASVLFVRSASSIRDVRGFVSLLSRRGDRLEVGGEGYGTHSHVTHMDFLEATGLKVVYRSFEKASQVRDALREEEIVAYWGGLSEVLRGDGEMEGFRPLALASGLRHPFFPEMVTWKEGGVDLESRSCFGLMIPETADGGQAEWLSKRAMRVNENRDYRNAVYKVGLEPFFVDWRDVGGLVRKEERRVKKLLLRYGIIEE
jgi:tripartite-type tricarboxylate transporter receptor subunit TctC